MKERVFVGLSGGVDSAVSAALLREQGAEVTGVFIKIWQPEFYECTWQRDRLDAMRVAAALRIPFRELDLSDIYKREVIEHLLDTYRRGMTPNPDVLCNRSVKFGAFMQWALGQGADAVATGHYAQVRAGRELLRGADAAKDQSYFLHLLKREELPHVRFPIGGMQKSEVRAKARSLSLPVAQKRDSQGLCFVGDVSMPEFLQRYISVQEGVVRDRGGNEIGRHSGAALYTIGQRHGFSVHADAPQYVIAIDPERNELTVSPDPKDGARTEARLMQVHWMNGGAPQGEIDVQTRYRERPVRARAVGSGDQVRFDAPHLFSPGQSLVAYDGEIVLGGGTIENV